MSSLAISQDDIGVDHGIVSCAVAARIQGRKEQSITQQADLLRARGLAMLRKLAKEKGANAVFGVSTSIANGAVPYTDQTISLVMLAQGKAVTRKPLA